MIKLQKLIILLVLASPFVITGQGYQVNLQGQAQQGMGGAGTAYIQDGASLFFNPGGACFLRGNSLNVGASPTITHGLYHDKASNHVDTTKSPVSYPFAVYGVFETKDSSKLKLGFAIYTPFGSTVKWQDEWTGRFVLTELQLRAIYLQPTVSYKITDKIGIGAGFVFASGQMELQRDIPLADANGNFSHAKLRGDAQGYGFNAGVYFKPIPQLSIGLNYRSLVNMKVESGDATFNVPSSLSSSFPNGKFKAKLPLPQVATLGFAFTPNDKLVLALDVNFVGWKAYDTLAFDYANNTSILTDTKSARNYKNTFAFRLGAQYKIIDKLFARVGIAYGLSPVQNGYVTPETPDADRVNITIGAGYLILKNFGVNASFLFSTFSRSDTNLETKINGTYKTNVFAPGLSLFYNF